ncbi:MAG: hypothetical protein ACRECF_02855 [Methyloceanibacter sp.]
MAHPAPETKEWKARQNLMPGPSQPKLIVIGKVQTSNTNQTPHLGETVPQGINPAILLLDLTITASGVGNTVMGWRDVRFEKPIRKDQYSSIEILWNGKKVGSAEVEDVH